VVGLMQNNYQAKMMIEFLINLFIALILAGMVMSWFDDNHPL
jgi:high-affinity Fe2+/Pb2+ permease